MNKYLKIAISIIVPFIICAPSCKDEQALLSHEEAFLNETRNEIRAEFETEYLTEASLLAYEKTAKQKLSDFYDYLHIMTDTSLDLSFRAKAAEMIKNSFLSENVSIQLASSIEDNFKELNVHLLVKNGLENKLSLPHSEIDSIVVSESLHLVGESGYSGTLRFLQNFHSPSRPGQMSNMVSKTADIYLIKENKVFGDDTMRVWNLRLGEFW